MEVTYTSCTFIVNISYDYGRVWSNICYKK